MKIPQWIFDDLKNKLKELLITSISSITYDGPEEWACETDNGTLHVQFSVSVDGNMGTFYLKIYNYTENIRITDFETDNPELVLQGAGEFKSKYINRM